MFLLFSALRGWGAGGEFVKSRLCSFCVPAVGGGGGGKPKMNMYVYTYIYIRMYIHISM